MSHKFSVTRGLVQLKRLEQRINKKIDILEEFVVANKVSSTKVITVDTLHSYLYSNDQMIQIPLYVSGNKHTIDNIDGYKWTPNPNGKVKILEHPVWSDLYKENMAKQ